MALERGKQNNGFCLIEINELRFIFNLIQRIIKKLSFLSEVKKKQK